MRKTIGIYTVNGHSCGGGHYTRMRVLESALLERGHEVYMDMHDPDTGLWCSAHPHSRPDVVVVDMHSFALTQQYIFNLKKACVAAKIAAFENFDDACLLEGVDLLVESSPVGVGVHNIVAPCFAEHARESLSIDAIFINQGDSDPWGILTRLLFALGFMNRKEKIHLVTGRKISKFLDFQLDQFALSREFGLDIVWHFRLTQIQMAKIMRCCGLAITAPGQTFAELAVVGVPSIVVSHHERHYNIGDDLELSDAAVHVGVGYELQDMVFIDRLEEAFRYIYKRDNRQKIITAARGLFNCEGVYEICKKIEGLL